MLEVLLTTEGELTAKLRQFGRYVEALESDDLSNLSVAELRLRIEHAKPLLSQAEDIHLKLACQGNPMPEGTVQEFSNSYFKTIAKAENLLAASAEARRVHGEDLVRSEHTNSNTNLGPSASARLPKLELVKFNGNFRGWQTFIDLFNSLVHNRSDISDIEKFSYLVSSLTNEALGLVKAIPLTASNYLIAYDSLVKRFANKRLMASNYWHIIKAHPPMRAEDAGELRKLIGVFSENLAVLRTMGFDPSQWNFILVDLLLEKVDITTRKRFELQWEGSEIPEFDTVGKFLEQQCLALETMVVNKEIQVYSKPAPSSTKPIRKGQIYAVVSPRSCPICKQIHAVAQCSQFLKLSPTDRHAKSKQLKLCLNCLGHHFIKDCQSSHTCRICSKRHHTLLHFETNQKVEPAGDHTAESTSSVMANKSQAFQSALLATATVKVRDMRGYSHDCRCLLDSGSQSHLVTETFADKLGTFKSDTFFAVQGVNSSTTKITKQTRLHIFSNSSPFEQKISCLILPSILGNVPTQSFDAGDLPIPAEIITHLADPLYNQSKPIDMLIGASLFWELMETNQISLGRNRPVLQNTKLGWVIAGPIRMSAPIVHVRCCTDMQALDNSLARFWKVEEPVLQKPVLSLEERKCEEHFSSTHRRDSSGRFIVSMPLNDEIEKLGDSRSSALKRFYNLENRLLKNADVSGQYAKFMSEYYSLNHMTEIDETLQVAGRSYYMPHHAVFKETSLSTKLRVVFDCSSKTSSGVSLNDAQHVGPVVQSDLLSILIRFRQYSFVVAADIKMMYRQILIEPQQRPYQRIFWRESPAEKLKCFELNTVTYGTASAPFLATKCLIQLAEETKLSYPEASEAIRKDMYMDDLLTGGDEVESLKQIRNSIVSILASAEFELRKFISNDQRLLEDLPESDNAQLQVLNFGNEQECKTLGVGWNASLDTIQYSIPSLLLSQVTKRTILAAISAIFDPFGLLGPVVIVAKLLIQALWESKLGWDETIPDNLHLMWNQIQEQLPLLRKLRIQRHVVSDNPGSIEIHGFCDASERAYGACIYLVSVNALTSEISCHLLLAKSKVAPLHKLTLARLELCGAVVLAHLVEKVTSSLKLKISKKYYWCDSTITLAWIRASPNKWKTFVANRVADIQNRTDLEDWNHVRSQQNPADMISRGVSARELMDSELWWKGPPLLSNVVQHDLQLEQDEKELELEAVPELRSSVSCCLTASGNFDIFARVSSFSKLKRVIVYIVRWKTKIRGPCQVSELEAASDILVKLAQRQSYGSDLHSLKKEGCVVPTSKILSLNPFLDRKGIIRVGGRLSRSQFEYNKKHPCLLDPKHPLTELILKSEHIRLQHCGPQALVASVRERFWPTGIRNAARAVVRKCVRCFRAKPVTCSPPLMGHLPPCRVTPHHVFDQVGVDYAGPMSLRTHKLRGAKLIKVYIALFICLATKAVHLEAVTDLSTEAFIATFRRFVSRRGKPSVVYSDNGGSFVKANRELNRFLKSKGNNAQIMDHMASEHGVDWHFIPPQSPTFGGVWEAGVRSVKNHLRRVVGNANLTFEDFYTVLVQIEAILNSRPLCPMSTDPHDLSALSPSHFLIGKRLMSLPERSFLNVPESRLSRFDRLQQMAQHFWSRWQKEYVAELQARTKWRVNHGNRLKKGALAVIKDDNLPPLKWSLGRVVELHAGQDNVVRVVSLRTAHSIIKRAVTKICVLPIDGAEL